MSEWKVLYRDHLDQDRTSGSVPDLETALRLAKDLYRHQRAELYRVEGPEGHVLPKDEVMRWVYVNKHR